MRRAVNRVSNCFRIASRFKLREAADRGDGAGFVLDDEAGQALIDDLGNGAAVVGDDRVPHAIASIMTRPNGSGQSIGNEQPDRAAEEVRFFMIADFADVIDERVGPSAGE